MYHKLHSDHGTICEKCGKLVYTVYAKDCGTGGVRVFCEKCKPRSNND